MTRRSDIQFGAPDRRKDAPTRRSHGRVCEQSGCGTVLSTYNASVYCWVHTAPSYKRPQASQG
jgi:hypothetical protein